MAKSQKDHIFARIINLRYCWRGSKSSQISQNEDYSSTQTKLLLYIFIQFDSNIAHQRKVQSLSRGIKIIV